MSGAAPGGGYTVQPLAGVLTTLPEWVELVRAPNPGPMTLDGTNTWILRASGHERCLVVDPGPDDEEHLHRVASHRPVALVMLTHGHPDHAESARRFAGLVDAAVVAMDPALCVGSGPLTADQEFDDAGLRVRVLATPGHTADSVCFVVRDDAQPAVLTGDTILGRGTTVVAWPDGDLGSYLDSLQQLRAVGAVPVLPGHGPPLADCAAAAAFYLEHRKARLDQVRAALAAGADSPRRIVEMVYADVHRALWPAAEMSVRAQLAFLERGDREHNVDPSRLDRP